MSKFELPTEDALECALQSRGIGGDFLREVAQALENGLSVIFRGCSMSIQIELPNGGSSVWMLKELFSAPPSNYVTYEFMKEVIEE